MNTTPLVIKTERKSMLIRPSGRSSDFITPSFDFGCLAQCTYCYLKRHKESGVNIATNEHGIVNSVIRHHKKLPSKVANQTHPTKWTYDVGCNHDVALQWKYHNYPKIFSKLISYDIFPTFATKYVNNKLLEYNPKQQARIRFSLMPQVISSVVEPNTSLITDRIKAINEFTKAGWDVHINFSPIIIHKNWLTNYTALFTEINDTVEDKDKVLAECIFLTHNVKKHEANLKVNAEAESLLWVPKFQESKTSQYGEENIRYEVGFKRKAIYSFTNLHDSIIPWNKIRYIF